MSSYGLIKATNQAMRLDTITDLQRLNRVIISNKLGKPIVSYAQSVRALENSVALGFERIKDHKNLPELVRGESFYKSCIDEIKPAERKRWLNYNKEEQENE